MLRVKARQEKAFACPKDKEIAKDDEISFHKGKVTNATTNGMALHNETSEDVHNAKNTNYYYSTQTNELKTNTTSTTEKNSQKRLYGRKYLSEITAMAFKDDFQPTHQDGPDCVLPASKFWTSSPEEPVRLRIGFTSVNSLKPKSVITIFDETRRRIPQDIAMSVKRDGKWVRWTFEQYWDEVCLVAKAFLKLGLERYHSVAILGCNAPEWSLSNLGTVFAGGIPTGMYTTNSADACWYVLQHSRANIAVVENEEQLQKILRVKHNLPHLKSIVQYIGTPTHEDIFSWEDVLEIGRSVPDEFLQARIKNIAVNQCCTYVYTSGTTGIPKAVMLSHDNIFYQCAFASDGLNSEIGRKYTSRVVSFLPLNHTAGQMCDIYWMLVLGGETCFAKPDALKGSLLETLQEAEPVIFMSVPRFYEKVKEQMEDHFHNSNVLRRSLIKWAMHSTYRYLKAKLDKAAQPPTSVLAKLLTNKIVSLLGFRETLVFASGGAPLASQVQTFFMGLNILLLDVYGMTECSGLHIVSTSDNFRPGSVGKLSSHHETKIINKSPDETGEICFKGRHVCMGYKGDEKTTKEAIDDDGWLHTGDTGRLTPDGFLYVTGRIKELIITAGGENIAPAPIEKAVKEELPIISNAVVVGDRRKFLSMLLTLKTKLDLNTLVYLGELEPVVVHWCASLGVDVKTVEDVLRGPDNRLMKAIQEGIDRANDKAPSNACRIQKWTIMPKDFSLAEGELSSTMKLKRNIINERYKNIIDSFY